MKVLAAGIRQRASGSGQAQGGGGSALTISAPSSVVAPLRRLQNDGGIANGHPEGPMTGRKIAKSPRDHPRQRRSPETVFLILSHLFTP